MEINDNYILECKNIYKFFGSVKALDNVTLRLKRNEILAIVGDNGAGKSTLTKIFSGALIPDEGKIFIDGKEVKFFKPKDAKEKGIEMVYQHLALIDPLSVAQNLYLGKEILKKYLFLNVLQNKKMQIGAKKFLKELRIDLKDTDQKVKNLSGGQRQSIAISKSVFWSDKILILDEPTAALGVKESQRVLRIISHLKDKGLSIIVITHNMEHAFMIADQFFVLRLGKKVGEKEAKKTNIDQIVKMITGGVFIEDKRK